MIPVELMYVLTPIAVILSAYAVWNLENRVYANIVLGGFSSSLLWFYLAVNVIAENVYYDISDKTEILLDTPMFWLFVLFGVVMSVYTLLLGVEAITERNIPEIGGEEE